MNAISLTPASFGVMIAPKRKGDRQCNGVTGSSSRGWFLLVLGLTLRIVMMMRSSDVSSSENQALHGRQLLRHYRDRFPTSKTPLLTQSALLGGLLLLLAGLGAEMAR